MARELFFEFIEREDALEEGSQMIRELAIGLLISGAVILPVGLFFPSAPSANIDGIIGGSAVLPYCLAASIILILTGLRLLREKD